MRSTIVSRARLFAIIAGALLVALLACGEKNASENTKPTDAPKEKLPNRESVDDLLGTGGQYAPPDEKALSNYSVDEFLDDYEAWVNEYETFLLRFAKNPKENAESITNLRDVSYAWIEKWKVLKVTKTPSVKQIRRFYTIQRRFNAALFKAGIEGGFAAAEAIGKEIEKRQTNETNSIEEDVMRRAGEAYDEFGKRAGEAYEEFGKNAGDAYTNLKEGAKNTFNSLKELFEKKKRAREKRTTNSVLVLKKDVWRKRYSSGKVKKRGNENLAFSLPT